MIKVPPRALFIFVIMILPNYFAAQKCADYISDFDGFKCVSQDPLDKGFFSHAFVVRKGDKDYILKISKFNKFNTIGIAQRELQNLLLFTNQPYVVQLVAYKITATHMSQIQEYGSKGSLEKILSSDENNYADHFKLLDFAKKLMIGLQTVHTKGLIHNDFKPANIVVDAKDDPIIIDFNTSIKPGDRSGGCGQSAYVDPLVLLSQGPIKSTVYRDIYSLGVILYKMSQKKEPFAGITREDVKASVSTNEYSFKENTNLDLVNIITSCLMIDETKRKPLSVLIAMVDEALKRKMKYYITKAIRVSNKEDLNPKYRINYLCLANHPPKLATEQILI